MLGNFSLSSADLFFQKDYFGNTVRVANDLDPDHYQESVCPDLGTNFVQNLSADNKSLHRQGKS